MFKYNPFVRLLKGQKHVLKTVVRTNTKQAFKLRRALLVTKLSRYRFEQLRHPGLNEKQLEEVLRNRGTDYETLIYYHNLHDNFEKKIANSFKSFGVEVRVVNRAEFRLASKEAIRWADLLVPVGGDGTFLLSAGRASPLFTTGEHKTPTVGFNSDPNRSEGRLMLPKEYSQHPEEAIKRILHGEFKWMHRSRIRVTLFSNNGYIPESTDLHEFSTTRMEQEKITAEPLGATEQTKYEAKMKRVIPYLALNEVFIGETLSARVSHLQIKLDESDVLNKTKCSGLCVSTGTGSTSWHTSINRLSSKSVGELLKILRDEYGHSNTFSAEKVSELYNQNLLFAPDDPRLCYSIREQICVGVWPNPKEFQPRDYVRKIYIKSKCIDASLVIDGSIAYPFNDGAKALLEVHPEDALLTISFD